jgi:hypothetical protein
MTDLSNHEFSQEAAQYIVDGAAYFKFLATVPRKRLSREELTQKELSLEVAQYIVDNAGFEDYPLDLPQVLPWLDSSIEDDEVPLLLVHNFEFGVDYKMTPTTPASLSIECFKALAILVGNEVAKTSRMYFIEAEKIARNRSPIARDALLRVLYDTAIAKCINYVQAEYAMNQFFCYQYPLEPISKYTMLLCLTMATQALELMDDGSLRGAECEHIIKEQFLRVSSHYKDVDNSFPPEPRITMYDLEDIEFRFYTHHF